MKKILLAPLFTVAITAHAQIYQCGNTLTDKPCEGGKTLASKGASGGVNSGASGSLYECLRPSDRQIWYSTNGCPEEYKQLALHNVPAALSVKDKIYIVEMRKQGRRALDRQKAARLA